MAFPFIAGYVLAQKQLTKAAGMAASAAAFRSQPATKVLDLSDRVDRLTMVVEAMWSLLKEKGVTDEQLIERIEQLDIFDGQGDAKVNTSIRCPNCGAAVTKAEDHCQFCGHQIKDAKPNPFARI